MVPYRAGGEVVAYIALLAGGGFCLAGADTAVLPVYFYSPRGTYDPASPDYQAILDEIATRTRAGHRAQTGSDAASVRLRSALAGRPGYWQELIAGHAPAKAAEPAAVLGGGAPPTSLVLPMTSEWDQVAPYWDDLPELPPGSGAHVDVGCNATATVQIMYYWKWPNQGTGSNCITYDYWYRTSWAYTALSTAVTIPSNFDGLLSYDSATGRLGMNGYWDLVMYQAAQGISSNAAYQTALTALWAGMKTVSESVCADFGSTTYDWSIMRDTNSEPPDDAPDQQAAQVSGDVAIGNDSDLGLWGTSSDFSYDASALINYFHYPYALDTTCPPCADANSLTQEISWGRLAGLGGSNSAGAGHAWVIDGYDESASPELFHMNFGWAGESDGWYTLDLPTPPPYPLKHDMMTQVAPSDVEFASSTATSGNGSPAQPYPGIEAAVTSAPAGSTIMLQAGFEYNFKTAPLVINRQLTLDGFGATIR
jgi:hypothetical protein